MHPGLGNVLGRSTLASSAAVVYRVEHIASKGCHVDMLEVQAPGEKTQITR